MSTSITEPAAVGPPALNGALSWSNSRNPWLVAVVATIATFMEMLDTSVANVSLPHIAGNLDVARSEATWVLTSYLAANAICLPMSGWISSRIGRKRYYMICVAAFTAASALCGLAPTLGWLVAFRVLQGIAGAGLGPCEQAILVETFPPAKRGVAMALYGMTVVVAPAIGPTLGGIITDHWSWRWMFFINVPLGVLSLVASARVLSDPPHLRNGMGERRPVDWQGLAMIALGLGTLEVVFDRGQEDGWLDSPLIARCIVTAAVMIPAFLVWEWRHKYPIIEVKLFKIRSFAVAATLAWGLGFVAYSATVLLPLYLQVLMGYSAQQAGMVLSPGGLTIFFIIPIVGQLVSRVDPRWLVTVGFAGTATALLWTSHRIDAQMDFVSAVQIRCLQCIGMGLLFVPIQAIAYAWVPVSKLGQVSGIMNLARNMGADCGISFLVTLIYRQRQVHQANLVTHVSWHDANVHERLGALSRSAMMSGASTVDALAVAKRLTYNQLVMTAMELSYIDVIWAVGIVTAALTPLAWLARRPARKPAALPTEPEHRRFTARVASVFTRCRQFRRGRWVWIGWAIATVVLLTVGAQRYLGEHESTDDAQVDGSICRVGARVSGVIVKVLFNENDAVHRGDVLAELDAADLLNAVDQARASVGQAKAELEAADPTVPSAQASNAAALMAASADVGRGRASLSASDKEVTQLEAEVARAEANARTATRERERSTQLFSSGSLARADYDRQVETDTAEQAHLTAVRQGLLGAIARVEEHRAELRASESRLVEIQSNGPRTLSVRRATVALRAAALEAANARLEEARRNLTYARIVAPVAGIVAKRAIAVGDHVEPGQQIAAVSESGTLWITANYRETQLRNIRPGQRATVRIDALGRVFDGTVASLGGATGARVSELPPENATGNYVKVVQRIPVRIDLRAGQPGLDILRIGFSAEPDVTIR